MKRKSLASVMFPKSVVTRLLILPTRFWALLEPTSFSSVDFWDEVSPSLAFGVVSDASGRTVLSVANSECNVSLSLASGCVVVMEAESGVVEAMTISTFDSLCVSAFMRIRKECSNTSWVMTASVRTSVRVYRRTKRQFGCEVVY